MALHQTDCDVCRQLQLDPHPRLVASLPQSVVVMGPHQVWPGYCVVLARQPVVEITDLPESDYVELMLEVRRVAAAVQAVTGCDKLNVESLGNQCHHLHWHVFPRQADEQRRLKPIWTSFPEDMAEFAFDAGIHAEMQTQLAARLNGRPS